MAGQSQPLPVRVYRSHHRIMVVAPMPGLEPPDISITVTGERVTIHGRERGPHQHDRDLILAQWAIGPYEGEVTLPEPVEGPLTNATYGNGVLVLAMPKVAPGQRGVAAEITLATLEATRGERVGHVSRAVRPTTTEEHLRQHRRRAIERSR
jgi:HSP20 family protein